MFTYVFDNDMEYILIGFNENIVFDGDICILEFKVNENATDTVTEISATPVVKYNSTVIDSQFDSAEFKVYTYVVGDIDGDEDVDIDDATYLFGWTMIPDYFPMNYPGDTDFNKDGTLDIRDASLLFNYSMLPDIYPLG